MGLADRALSVDLGGLGKEGRLLLAPHTGPHVVDEIRQLLDLLGAEEAAEVASRRRVGDRAPSGRRNDLADGAGHSCGRG